MIKYTLGKDNFKRGKKMTEKKKDNEHIHKAVDAAIRIGFLALLIMWCFTILKPVIVIVIWGIIIAVGISPVHDKLTKIFRGRKNLSAIFIMLLGIGILVIPTMLFMNATVGSIQGVAKTLESGSVNIRPPKDSVESLPIIGKQLHDIWSLAATNLEEAMVKFKPQLQEMAPKILAAIAGFGVTLIQFVISVIVAGVLLMNSEAAGRGAEKVFDILVGDYVDDFPKLAAGSIRSVVQGVLGIAFIQAVLSGAGMLVVGVPAVGLWCILILILGIMQLPPTLVLLPICAYVFSVSSTTPAIIFLVYCLFVGLLDNLLKPLLLGRGVDVPMLVILLGAIGGMVSYGIIGLFVGSVVLALGYKVLEALMEKNYERRMAVVEDKEDKE